MTDAEIPPRDRAVGRPAGCLPSSWRSSFATAALPVHRRPRHRRAAGRGRREAAGFPPIDVSPDLVLLVLLPGLVFEAAYRLRIAELRRWIGGLVLLAVPGVLISAAVVAVVLNARDRAAARALVHRRCHGVGDRSGGRRGDLQAPARPDRPRDDGRRREPPQRRHWARPVRDRRRGGRTRRWTRRARSFPSCRDRGHQRRDRRRDRVPGVPSHGSGRRPPDRVDCHSRARLRELPVADHFGFSG